MNAPENVTQLPAKSPSDDGASNIEDIKAARCTDVANAERFCQINASFVRHVHEWGWLVWYEGKWTRDHGDLVREAAQGIGNVVRQEATRYSDPDIATAFFRHAKYTQSSKGIDAMLREARPKLRSNVEDFDQLPLAVCCRNVTLHFGRLPEDAEVPEHEEHNKALMLTRQIPTEWHMGAARERWETFLEKVLPDAEVRAYVKRAAGYSLLGLNREQCFFVLYGEGANGKSTFLNVLLHVLGTEYARLAHAGTFMLARRDGSTNDLAALAGVRFLVVIETGQGRRLDESLVKQFTGGDSITARYLFREYFTFTPQAKLWLATNHKPTIDGTDEGMWRRVRLIPFTQRFEGEQRDPNIESKLKLDAEGVLAWAVEGAVEYMHFGLDAPDAVLAATAEYRADEDVLGQFLAECCTTDCPDATVPASKLFAAYQEWSGKRGLSQTKFGKAMTERGFNRSHSRNGKIYKGLKLVEGVSCE